MVGRESHYLETGSDSHVRIHMARSSNGRTLGSLPGYEDSISSCATKGCSRPIYANRARGWIVCSFRKLPPAQPNIQASFFTALLEACDMWLVI